MDRIKGFSLIELMVVIAIVGVLAAVAGPVVKSYIMRAKVAAATQVLDELVQTAKVYYQKTGTFGDLQQMGYTGFSPGNHFSTPLPTTLGEYYMEPYVALMMVEPSVSTCPAAVYTAYISNFGNGGARSDTNVNADLLIYSKFVYVKNSVVMTDCAYVYTGVENNVYQPLSQNLIPGCFNTFVDPYDFDAISNSC